MKHSLWIALFLCGVLLAACTKQNSPLLADAPASSAPGASAGAAAIRRGADRATQWDADTGYYYLARENGGDFVLHFVDFATLQDAPVCSAGCAHTDEGCTRPHCVGGLRCDGVHCPGAAVRGLAGRALGERRAARRASCVVSGTVPTGRNWPALTRLSRWRARPPGTAGVCIASWRTTPTARRRSGCSFWTRPPGSSRSRRALPLLDTAIVGACGRELVLRFGEGTQAGWGLWNVDSGSWKEFVRCERPVSAACDGEASISWKTARAASAACRWRGAGRRPSPPT